MHTINTTLAGAAALFITVTATAGVPCGDWNVVGIPAHDGTPVIPRYITPFAPDHALALGTVPGVGYVLMSWDGATWTTTETGPLGISPAEIRGATIHAADDIWACGITVADAHGRPFIAHWDGQSWDATIADVLDNPNPDGGDPLRDAEGSDLAVCASDDIWVIGNGDSIGISGGNAGDFVACHWDGSSLEEPVIVTNGYNRINQVSDVDTAASDDIWAVGYGRNISESFHVLMYHWDGTEWTPFVDGDWTPLPGTNSFTETLWDVAVPAPNDAWAVGDKNDGSGTSKSLYLHWDGSSWTEIAGPDIGPLTSIADNGPDDVWVTCGFGEFGGRLAHWDGTSWTEVPSASLPGATHIGLGGLAAGGDCNVWATGYWAIYNGAGGWDVYENVIEHLAAAALCDADCNGDGVVNVEDLVAVVLAWGTEAAAEDVNGDGVVGVDDLIGVMTAWGPCG